jgi:hypothetical protein
MLVDVSGNKSLIPRDRASSEPLRIIPRKSGSLDPGRGINTVLEILCWCREGALNPVEILPLMTRFSARR